MKTIFLSLLMTAFVFSGCATWKGAKKDSSKAWDGTKKTSKKVWKKTKEGATEAYEYSKEKIHDATSDDPTEPVEVSE